jgi:hypothetical protein
VIIVTKYSSLHKILIGSTGEIKKKSNKNVNKPLVELMLGASVQALHVPIIGASLGSQGLLILFHILYIQNVQINISFIIYLAILNFL